MNLQPITALSPLDGRYESKVSALRDHFSEFGLIRNRVKVEIEWLKALAAAPELAEPAPRTVPLEEIQRYVAVYRAIKDAYVEPIDDQRHQHLRVELEDATHQGVLGGPPRDVDDLPDQAVATGLLPSGALRGLGDDGAELDHEQRADQSIEVVVAAVDRHPADPRPPRDLRECQAAEADLQDALVRGAEHRVVGCRPPAVPGG